MFDENEKYWHDVVSTLKADLIRAGYARALVNATAFHNQVWKAVQTGFQRGVAHNQAQQRAEQKRESGAV